MALARGYLTNRCRDKRTDEGGRAHTLRIAVAERAEAAITTRVHSGTQVEDERVRLATSDH